MNTYQDLRKSFSEYFLRNNHAKIESSSLIPYEDKSLMFTNSGMVQFKNIFLGIEEPKHKNVTTIQKSLRAGGKHNDLDNVGYTSRHHTFFEMLGNFSFGGYFKEEAICHAWNFLTKELQLDKNRLYITVYHTDEEAFSIWKKITGFSDDKIIKISTNDNFWSMGDIGPCGPSSEIFYDYGDSVKGGLPGTKDQDGDRFCEIWNLVFMQNEKMLNGEIKNLPKKCIDTGMGLERLASVIEGKTDNYKTSFFTTLIQNSRETYNDFDSKNDVNHRVIADHLRSISFLIADGITPSNEGRGYVLRRIMRRAMRYAHEISAKEVKMHTLFDNLQNLMQNDYPELKTSSDMIKNTIASEEISFKENLSRGIELIYKELSIDSVSKIAKNSNLSGKIAFKLYDTHGFPIDMTQDIMKRAGGEVDMAEFEVEMNEQKSRSKASWKGGNDLADGTFKEIASNTKTSLDTDLNEILDAKLISIVKNGGTCEKILKNDVKNTDEIWVLFEKNCFYPESGGQEGDFGTIFLGKTRVATVTDTQKKDGLAWCKINLENDIKIGELFHLKPSLVRRNKLKSGHTATHLLQASLKQNVNKEIKQMGSKISEFGFRFDFNHTKPLSDIEISKIEEDINDKINSGIDVLAKSNINKDEAVKLGAIANFGDKYGDLVRVISVSDVSTELCGGMHANNTAEIGGFKIVKCYGISSGVYRIEAIVGEVFEKKKLLELGQILDCKPEDVNSKIKDLIAKVKSLENDNQALEIMNLANQQTTRSQVGSYILHIIEYKNQNGKLAKDVCFNIAEKLEESSILIAVFTQESSQTISVFSKNTRVNARNLLHILTEKFDKKSGGGTEKFAMSGLKNSVKIDDLSSFVLDFLSKNESI